MKDWISRLQVTKSEANLLVLFIPSVDRWSEPIDQNFWIDAALEQLGRCFGGATAFPQGRGVWRDDERGGRLVYDEPVVIQCYTSEEALDEGSEELRQFLIRMGTESRQGAVGFVIDRHYLEIQLPLQET
jgi:hypothetical protein